MIPLHRPSPSATHTHTHTRARTRVPTSPEQCTLPHERVIANEYCESALQSWQRKEETAWEAEICAGMFKLQLKSLPLTRRYDHFSSWMKKWGIKWGFHGLFAQRWMETDFWCLCMKHLNAHICVCSCTSFAEVSDFWCCHEALLLYFLHFFLQKYIWLNAAINIWASQLG